MGTNRELAAAASLAARAAASNRSMKISAIIAVPSMVRSTRLDGRTELSVQSFDLRVCYDPCLWPQRSAPGQHNRASLFLVDLPAARDLLLRAKHLFAAAILAGPQASRPIPQGTGHHGLCASAWRPGRLWNTGSLGFQPERFDKGRPLGFFAVNICGVFFRR